MKKTFLFVTDTYYKDGKLTGAHKRFLELVRGTSKIANVILITREIPQLYDVEAERYLIGGGKRRRVPDHLNGMIDLAHTLVRVKNKLRYDYAISFGPTNTICLKWCGYKNIISLFREDLIGYQKVLGATNSKLLYSKLQERIAVKASDKIIVQCENDKKNLVLRNERYDKNIQNKVFIQINNANASWMNTDTINDSTYQDDKVRIFFIGSFSDKRKGHSIIIPAISKLLDDGFSIEFYIAGDGQELDSYKQKYNKYQQIHFLGRVDNIPYYLSISDFEMVPSFIDSCPNTVLEGINAGVAVYGAKKGGIPDLLEKDKYMFEPDINSIYQFTKDKIEKKAYVQDANEQRKIKEKLTFDWSAKILDIIVNN